MSNSILIHNCALLTTTAGQGRSSVAHSRDGQSATADTILDNGWLLTQGNTIAAIGVAGDLTQQKINQATTIIDGQGKLLMPGLINGHNHCAMTLFRGLADDLELSAWLTQHIFPAEATHVNQEMVYHCSKLAAAEMIRSGTTSVADGYFLEDQAVQAFIDTGIRAVAAQGIIDFPAPGALDPRQNLAVATRFLDTWQGRHSRVTAALFAHSPYTCSNRTLQGAKRLATEREAPFFIHVAESSQEQGMIQNPLGATPIKHLAALDLLSPSTICIHCVWLDDDDLDILAQTGAGVVVCPQSHLKLASGMAPVTAMTRLGIKVGLGTDGSASNNSLDMFREMDMLSKTQKLLTLTATALPARQALQCATTNNAALLGLGKTAQLIPGFKADLILLDMQQPHLTPFYNQDLLVYSATGADVHTVIIDGQLIMNDRKITSFDVQATMREVHRLACKITPISRNK